VLSVATKAAVALVLFPPTSLGLIMLSLMLFHQIQLFVCAVSASRLARD
jgi:solute carrier family 10 (sodium/bile acid cotransporter), member 7